MELVIEMINIAVCDDDINAVEEVSTYLCEILKKMDIQFDITCFNEGQDLIDEMTSSEKLYDIIFLDVFMKASNGINIARKIREFDKECKIIFITSSKEYAVESYDVRAIYYILKPINEEKLNNAINIAIESLNKENKHIIIKNKKGSYRIAYKDILYAESKARVVNIYDKDGEVISFYSKLEDFFQSLQDERFLRCHKSFVVNMDYILKIEQKYICINNNINIPISSRNVLEIKEKYFKYLFNEI